MDNYIVNRVRAAAKHTLELSEIETSLPHKGLRGRFRELLIDNILVPWLPPYTQCGTGMIIAAENLFRESTQDDIIIYDRSLVPPVLASSLHAPEGIFLYNSVLARVEVKSTLTRADIRAFVSSSLEIAKLKHSVQAGCDTPFTSTFNFLFAFASDAIGEGEPDYQLRRLIECMTELDCDPLSGIVSMLCIPSSGFWKIGEVGGKRAWLRLSLNTPADNLAWFIGCISNTCYLEHARKQGRDPNRGLEGGIGMYFPAPYETAKV